MEIRSKLKAIAKYLDENYKALEEMEYLFSLVFEIPYEYVF
jgi:hypothetical protein